ncbi:glycosyltransferase family 10 domain-containing protein [Mesorhizobium sp. ES1-1]|uniref:glycosyltransferase family 10 domain-containing protein n=1 Tax=Mesorhizobium sp. ES1-1 TaxID=2876629 RepID=UPI001CCA5441|nr:glycosyltransferase family 10 [Mesorhizobium sp. ES1-1]MBZ9674998.1 glycosyltransferase family 10 fucosyltransferase [Mesorhizobium sp. ES1-1]
MSSSDPLILFYTSFFRKPVDIEAIREEGRWTTDKGRLSEAAAVVFHIPDFQEIGDARKYPGQYWVAWSMESRQNYSHATRPEAMKHFDIIMTHEAHADVWTPYLPKAGEWQDMVAKPIARKTEQAPVALFQSAPFNLSGRADFTAQLSRHIRIDSYGRHFNNRTVSGPDLGRKTKIETIARHRFCLALENSIEPDYVTEKIYDAFEAGTVPIYLGAPNVNDFVPGNSYIDASAFPDEKTLADYLRHVVATPEEYDAYFAWRSKPLPDTIVKRLPVLETPHFRRLTNLVRRKLEAQSTMPSGRSTLPFGRMSFLRTRLRRWRKRIPG